MKLCNVLFLVSGQKNERICLDISRFLCKFAIVNLRKTEYTLTVKNKIYNNMDKDFASSSIMRQNVLNNQLAVAEIQKTVGISGVFFEGEYKFFKKQIADFFEVTERTIELCIEKHGKELERNGYEVLRGKRLIDLKLVLQKDFGTEIDFGTKTTI